MKYYYTLGKFTERVARKDMIFSHHGWDVRSWVLTLYRKEVSKEQYMEIVTQDKEIVKDYKKKYSLEITTFHNPHKEEQ